jgi:uncharacterized OB-fold protein
MAGALLAATEIFTPRQLESPPYHVALVDFAGDECPETIVVQGIRCRKIQQFQGPETSFFNDGDQVVWFRRHT